MEFFFDESGDFAVPSIPDEHRVAIVVGLAVPEVIGTELDAAYAAFVATLSGLEMSNGEPKGSGLTAAHRIEFCEILGQFRGSVSLAPVTLDLGSLVGLGQSTRASLKRSTGMPTPWST